MAKRTGWFLVFAFILALMFSLSGCGGGSNEGSNSQIVSEAPENTNLSENENQSSAEQSANQDTSDVNSETSDTDVGTFRIGGWYEFDSSIEAYTAVPGNQQGFGDHYVTGGNYDTVLFLSEHSYTVTFFSDDVTSIDMHSAKGWAEFNVTLDSTATIAEQTYGSVAGFQVDRPALGGRIIAFYFDNPSETGLIGGVEIAIGPEGQNPLEEQAFIQMLNSLRLA